MRTILNKAIEDNLFDRNNYPFGKRKYKIPTGSNVKKALEIDEITKIYNFKTVQGSILEKAKDYFIFSYFANGMNPKDICRLKYSDINGDTLSFIRAKTERTKKDKEKRIYVDISEEMTEIIEKYGTKGNGYIFPILSEGLSPKREMELVQYFVKRINEGMKTITDDLKINKKVTSYVARHSFSTISRNTGSSIEYISEALGHEDLKTTGNYLASFDSTTRKKNAKGLKLKKEPV